jgi:3-hydroxyacyl-[acyl-carrier-protein] dehydratase
MSLACKAARRIAYFEGFRVFRALGDSPRSAIHIELIDPSGKEKWSNSTLRLTMILDTIGIQKILPHRYPFLLIDGIEEMERWKRIVGIKNVTINESYFQGHFPGKPIMPGVLIIESMAQTGGLLLLKEVPDREKKLLYFVSIDNARFRRPVVPGDQLRIEMNVLAWRNGFCKLEGRATVEGQLAAEATLMCKMVDLETEMPPVAEPAEKAQ